MNQLPSTQHASTQARLDHQFKDWENCLYVHSPEFDKVFDRLMPEPPPSGYASNGREYHEDWKSR